MTACVLLAAGASTRLGSPKQLIDVDGEPLVRRVARQLQSLDVGPVSVVLGANGQRVGDALVGANACVIVNDQWSGGMGTSIRAGIGWAESVGATAALVALCDQPDVDVAHLRCLLTSRGNAAISASEYDGSRGVPAVFDVMVFARLRSLPDDRGAKRVLNDPSLACVRVRCEAARVDLDTPEDVERWRAHRLGLSPTPRKSP